MENKNFFLRLFNIIDLPLFLGFLLILVFSYLETLNFYFENIFLILILNFILLSLIQFFSGFRASKLKLKIKPFIAGFFTAFILSFFAIILSYLLIYFFPFSSNLDGGGILYENQKGYEDGFEQEIVYDINEDNFDEDFENDVENLENSNVENLNLESNIFNSFSLFFNFFKIIISSIFGMFFGFLGGIFGKE